MSEYNNSAPQQPPMPPVPPAPPVQQAGKGFSIAAMVLSIIAVVMSCWFYVSIPCGIIGLILGIVAVKGRKPGYGMAIAGIVLSAIGLAAALLTILLAVIGIGILSQTPQWAELTSGL